MPKASASYMLALTESVGCPPVEQYGIRAKLLNHNAADVFDPVIVHLGYRNVEQENLVSATTC
jgi:hypothetical protein